MVQPRRFERCDRAARVEDRALIITVAVVDSFARRHMVIYTAKMQTTAPRDETRLDGLADQQ